MWSIIFVLPNIKISEPLGNEYLCLVPDSDPKIKDDISSNHFAKVLVENFTDQFGRKINPTILLINDSAPDYIKNIDAITAFRNALAISTIIRGHEHSFTHSFNTYPLYTDFFDFYPLSITIQKDGFIWKTPSCLGCDDDYEKFSGQLSPGLGLPGDQTVGPNDYLFELLHKAWMKRFLKQKLGVWHTRTLFRSLEMAYQAASMPYKNHSTLYDYGSSASLWVSAFEILSHPRTQNANLLSVINLLGKYKWNHKKVGRNSYKIKYNGVHRVNLVQKLYKELYDTRNCFLHGNPVRKSRLYPFKNMKTQPITLFAPLIYKIALLSHFQKPNSRPLKRSDKIKEYLLKISIEKSLCEALLKSKKT